MQSRLEQKTNDITSISASIPGGPNASKKAEFGLKAAA